MFNISENTIITGFNGKIGTLQQALHDKNIHKTPKFSYYGKSVTRGSVEVCLKGEWRTIVFDEKDGWMRTVEVM